MCLAYELARAGLKRDNLTRHAKKRRNPLNFEKNVSFKVPQNANLTSAMKEGKGAVGLLRSWGIICS